ncbi:hypothetical protein [Nocardioides pantholopis]|uniref:hypothetical protein n=1 Tax=Nocardioides pantholopis TaxID=2483798 RepID=UPI000F0776F0|nr:hypothetical protein [Nocardioides pantholopis]
MPDLSPTHTIQTLDHCLLDAAQHASRALCRLDGMRNSPDPQERRTYAELHSVLGDLGGARILLVCLAGELDVGLPGLGDRGLSPEQGIPEPTSARGGPGAARLGA